MLQKYKVSYKGEYLSTEPYLLVRAQDVLAPFILGIYLEKYRHLTDANPDVIRRLEKHLTELLKWQIENPTKIAD